jgi:hypothetical protein
MAEFFFALSLPILGGTQTYQNFNTIILWTVPISFDDEK